VLKDATALPVTQLWFSNGGKTEAPWSGTHTGVLGIEDARVPTGRASVPVGLQLAEGTTHIVSHAIGAIRRPPGWSQVDAIELRGAVLELTGDNGRKVTLPFQEGFF